MHQVLTTCTLDCPDACSLEATVDGDQLVKVGAPRDGENPLTDGWICAKVKQLPELVHGSSRITQPLLRSGPKDSGEFEPISWDAAIALIVERIQEAVTSTGWSAVAPYLYSSSAGMQGCSGLSPLVWEALGAARVDVTICAATSARAWELTFGELQSADPYDIVHSELYVSWGANPNVSNSHYAPIIRDRCRNGMAMVVVDPVRTPLAAAADLHLAVRPGTDVVLAMAVAHLLNQTGHIDRDFADEWIHGTDEYLAACAHWSVARAADVCGLPAADIERFADLYHQHRPALLRVGWGMERNRNGGSATRAVLALPALAGHFGRPGAGVLQATVAPGPYRPQALRAATLGATPSPDRRPINMNRLGRVLTEHEGGRVDVLFVQGSNPAASCPQQTRVLQGLSRDDLFTVVHDFTMTDTARFADLVLPATTQFEVDEVVAAYGTYMALDAPAAIPRVGESKTNDEVSAAIGVGLGLDPVTWDPDPQRVRALAMGDRSIPTRTLIAGSAVQFGEGSTNNGPITLAVDAPDADRLPTYRPPESTLPLTLISPATSKTISTMFGGLTPASTNLRLDPADARERGLADGDRALVTDGDQTIEVTITVGSDLRPGVAAMPKGMWRKDGDNGLTVNALIPDALADLAGGATFNDARVEVTALA